jgi:hypothetical protein
LRVDQRHPEPLLEPRDPRADRRRRHSQLSGCGRETSGVHYLHEDIDAIEDHAAIMQQSAQCFQIIPDCCEPILAV